LKPKEINIIIPCCNRPHELNRLLLSLKQSIRKWNDCVVSKIIICDDSNNDSVKNLLKNSHSDLKWVKGPRKGPGSNRNIGLNETTTTCEWIIFIDDDCYVNDDFINSYCRMMQKNLCNVIEGKITCPNKKNSIFVRQPDNNNGGVLASGNFAIKKSLFLAMNGFDEDFKIMEDIEFAQRLKSIGEPFMFCENAIAFHPSQSKSIFYYYNWIFHFKWQILLDYKCNGKDPNQVFIKSSFFTIFNHLIFLIRITYHLITKFDKERWIMYTFERTLAWISLPVVIPHLIFWDFIFRKRINKHCKKSLPVPC
jgi:GT2 family glycosyltransferase